ncbi:acylphosphatase [Methylacidimicrobium sp. B4]|uniref:acylphosphatase n=1 Tax=Methylacidimicrobium sp. B4 TaxID=2796139 RepID=UPI001A8BFBDC|nr:acylphosphatase [Methylacidimicrobium sp. B4]QSR84252.1 acylphosphatase [Methylacidimicrobium sp. B4]
MKKRLRAIYSGRVQGVGFRATVARIARTLPLEGWVWNRRDGCVELLVEGEESAIAQLLQGVAMTPPLASGIESVEAVWEEPAGDLRGFVIAWEEGPLSGR